MGGVYKSKRGIYYLKCIVSATRYMIHLNSWYHLLPADGDKKNQSYIKADVHHYHLTSPLSGTFRGINPIKNKPKSLDVTLSSQILLWK